MGSSQLGLLSNLAGHVQHLKAAVVDAIWYERKRFSPISQRFSVPINPGYALAILASKVFSRREINGITPGRLERCGGLQGSRSRQSSTASDVQNVEIPVPHGRGDRRGLQVFLPGQVSTSFYGADHVENPVPRVGGLHGFRPGRVSSASSSHSPGAVDEHFTGVFRTFPQNVRSWVRTRGRNCPRSRAHPRGELML